MERGDANWELCNRLLDLLERYVVVQEAHCNPNHLKFMAETMKTKEEK